MVFVFMICNCKNENKDGKVTVMESTENFGTLYEVNTDQSIIYWIGSSALKSHNGSLKFKDGRMEIDVQGNLKGGSFHMDMSSIVNLDITEPKDKKDLEDHLKSADFLAIDTFPEADFIITKVNYNTDSVSNSLIEGDLTIRGITKGIQVKANVIPTGNSAMITIPEFGIDRTLWNINFHSSKIMDLVKDKLINDEIKLSMKIIAIKK